METSPPIFSGSGWPPLPSPPPPPPHLKVWIDHCVPSVVVHYYAEIWTVKQHKFLLHSHVSTETEQEKPTCISYIFQTDNFLFHRRKYSIPREKFYNQIQQNFVDFNQLSYTELIIKLMNSQNFPVNSHFLKFVSWCNDLRTNLSNHADDTWLTVVIIALYYHCYKL